MKKAKDILITQYQNEKNTEEILPYSSEIVDFYEKAIPSLTSHMNSLTNTIVKSIIEQELERVKYFLKEYLMIRAKKIFLRMKIKTEFLSEKENLFHQKMVDLYKNEGIFVDEKSVSSEVVGFISNISNKNILLDNKEVELKEGDFYIANIQDVLELLYNNEINLV